MLDQRSASAGVGAAGNLRAQKVNVPVAVPKRAQIVMAMLTKAAEMGDPCPSNAVLATATGAESVGTPAATVSLLEAMGLITVQRFAASRVVTITATGKSTKAVSGLPLSYGARRTRRPLWSAQITDGFAELLADGMTSAQAGREMGLTTEQARTLLRRICRSLGHQAR